MDKMVRTGLLYDFYGGLLTEKQRRVMELYYLENWSLAEIADDGEVSKQAVYDLLQRTERIIEDFEQKLGLLKRFLNQQMVLEDISAKLQRVLASLPENNPNYKVLAGINQQIAELSEAEMD